MTQDKDPMDTEGHKVPEKSVIARDDDDDTEGHKIPTNPATPDDDDVQGHKVPEKGY
ncbi:MAG TPA: hypothetical protein VK736_04035 [Candidatus Binatia bacterium]|nr:hypothetical protein [Candidatus Binatia bacterium]